MMTRKQCIGQYDSTCATGDVWMAALGVPMTDAYDYLSQYGIDNWDCNPSTGYNG